MSNIARLHHYVPQWYLAKFTDSGDKNGKFYVFDKKIRKTFRTSPRNVAAVRDYNRIELPCVDPNIIETGLAEFENLAVRVLRSLSVTHILPTGEDYSVLVNFLALLAARNPRYRRMLSDYYEVVIQKWLDYLLSKKKTWDRGIQELRKKGFDISNNVTFESMSAFVKDNNFAVNIPNVYKLKNEFSAFESILPCLHHRTWSVLVPKDTGVFFIASDHPLILSWTNPGIQFPLGFGLKKTEVLVPISKRCALVGTFEGDHSPHIMLDKYYVAEMNRRIIQTAERQYYSSTRTISTLDVVHDK